LGKERNKEMRKQFKGFIVGFILACLLVVPTTALADNIQAYFNTVNLTVDGNSAVKQGENYQLEDGSTVPFSINYKGTTYIPIRKVSELLGITINYDNSTKTVQIKTNSKDANTQGKTNDTSTTNSAVTASKSYAVFNECSKSLDSNGQKVAHAVGFMEGKKLDINMDYSYYNSISSNLKSILLWETSVDSKGNITKIKAVSASKSGSTVSADNRNSVTLSSGEYALENKVVIYQWTDDNEYKLFSGNLKAGDEVYLYDTNSNKKYDVVIFTRGYNGKVSEGDTSASKEGSSDSKDSTSTDKQSKASAGYAVINECNKNANDDGDKVQQIVGFKDGSKMDALTSESNTIKNWSEPKLTDTGFNDVGLYKISLNKKGIVISAEKVSANVEQGKAEEANQRKSVVIGGKTYNLSDKAVVYQVTKDDEYKLFSGNLKENDMIQLYETDSSEAGYDIVIFSRP